MEGFKTFRLAVRGEYTSKSEDIREIEKQLFRERKSDRENLRGDWKNVTSDVRKAYEQYKLNND